MYCGLCAEACPTGSLRHGQELEEASFIDPRGSADEILEKLRNLEHSELADAVNGPSYKTIWSKPEQL